MAWRRWWPRAERGTADGLRYVVSELLDGQTLRERMGGTVLPTRKVLDYAIQGARGLAAAHEKGIVHRDLKPENLLIEALLAAPDHSASFSRPSASKKRAPSSAGRCQGECSAG